MFHLGIGALEKGIRRREALDNGVLGDVAAAAAGGGPGGETQGGGEWFATGRAPYSNSIRRKFPKEAGVATEFWVKNTQASPSEVLVKHAKVPHPYKSKTERYKVCPRPFSSIVVMTM
jgi:hypothetical protein